jgi:hypothetical protein
MALSADAKTLAIGAASFSGNTDKMGYVKVYHTDKGDKNRMQLGQTIYRTETADWFGYSRDITADGTRILLGSPVFYDNTDKPGYVQVFSLDRSDNGSTSTWKQIGQDITGSAIGNNFSASVSISDDGNTIAVGALHNNGKNGQDLGHVRINHLVDNGTSWGQIGEDIDGKSIYDFSGRSVSLSANGSIVAIGAPFASINGVRTGQVKVYQMDSAGSSWEQLGQSIYGNNADDEFGQSVDISPDGNNLAIGSGGNGPGFARVLFLEEDEDLCTSSWKQIDQYITGEAFGNGFGSSVSLSENAKTLAVCAWFANGKNGVNLSHVGIY